MRGIRHSAARGWLTGIVLVLGAMLAGCGTPEQRYKILSFFFDGVPDPSQTTQKKQLVSSSGRPVYIHAPYAENQCDACHLNTRDIFARARVKPDACISCHADVAASYPVMHGPVAAKECLQCHQPHQASEVHLLKYSSPRICVQCHETELLSTRVPEHSEQNSGCLTCHSGHGGEDRNFLLKIADDSMAAPAEGSEVVQ